MKILWHSNAPWAPTGYGAQTKLVAPEIAKHHDLAISAFFGLQGGRLTLGDISVYPNAGENFGNEVLGEHARQHFGGSIDDGIVITLMDTFVLDAMLFRRLNAACWAPVDHAPAPPAVRQFFAESQAIPIAMSKFGAEQLAEFAPLYVPHAVDTKVMRPRSKPEARKRVGFDPDAFVVGVVAANKGNPSRKSYQEILQAFAEFRRGRDDAQLYLHTEVRGIEHGVDLEALLAEVGLGDGHDVLICDQYRYRYDPWPAEYLASIYSGIDVLLNPSAGEGFGIPVLEAQACGTPAIVSDFSAMPEVCGAGWHVETDPVWTPQGSWQCRPRIADIVGALEEAYGLPRGPRRDLSRKAVKHAARYDIEKVVRDDFLPAIEEISRRLEARRPTSEPTVLQPAPPPEAPPPANALELPPGVER